MFVQPGATQAGGYVLAVASLLVAVPLLLHPPPTQGFEESASQLRDTPLWGAIHVSIAFGCVLCVLGALLVLVGGGPATRTWTRAFSWGALAVGMLYFSGVSLVNGWVLHGLAQRQAEAPLLYDAMNDLLVGFGWLGNPLYLLGLTGIALHEALHRDLGLPRWLAWGGLAVVLLSWGRGVGSATGLYFLEPLIFANVPALLWLGLVGLRLAREARNALIPPPTSPLPPGS